MAKQHSIADARTVRLWRAKADLYDELVEHLASVEDELEKLKEGTPPEPAEPGIDPAWQRIASDLAGALRPYTMFREQTVENGRIVVHVRVPGSTLRRAREALERLGEQVARESRRRDGLAEAREAEAHDAEAA
jgi:hypothetical protein